MTDIEIPLPKDRTKRYRFFEILPGFLSWTILIVPVALAIVKPSASALFIIAYMLIWFAKNVGISIRAVQGVRLMHKHMKLPWPQLVDDIRHQHASAGTPSWHQANIKRLQNAPPLVQPDDVIHAVIIAAYNESRAVLEPTIESVVKSDYDPKKVILVLAYEERGGPAMEEIVRDLKAQYGDTFLHTMAVKHPPDLPNEVVGKGGNITFAGRKLQEYVEKQGIDLLRVVVTTLDVDTRPHKKYLAALTYLYCLSPDPVRVSFQPVAMYTNNIWDAPALMRVVATGNSMWNTVLSLRPHVLRNFSAHAQGLQGLIETEFWSVRTIVEDGHQFWRSYFRFDGQYEVYPMYLPIYQDAVLAKTYIRTLKAQFIQLRRWAWGASDIAFVAEAGYFRRNKVPKVDLTFKFLRLLEGHVSWASSALLITIAAFIPAFLNPEDYASNQLPLIASRIQTFALAGILVTLFFTLKTLPPKPERYKRRRTLLIMVQWVVLPIATIGYHATAALYSQTRLMLGKYLGYVVTEKTVIKENKEKVT